MALRNRRLAVAPIPVIAGVIGAGILALSLNGSLAAFSAQITNSNNTAQTATLLVTETGPTGTVAGGTGTCNSWDATTTCSTINKYGGTNPAAPLKPGDTRTITVKFTNNGSLPLNASTLTFGACTATAVAGVTGAATPGTAADDNLCKVLNVAVYAGATATGTALKTGNPDALTAGGPVALPSIPVGATQDYTFVVNLPATATVKVQGQQVSQPLTWNFAQ